MGKNLKKYNSDSSKYWKIEKNRELRRERKNQFYKLNKSLQINGYENDEYYQEWSECEIPKKIKAASYEKPHDNFKFLTPKYNNIVKDYVKKNFDYECYFGKFADKDRIEIYSLSNFQNIEN